MSQDIYVVVEHLRGEVAEITYAMLAAARVLAEGTGGKVVAVLLGQNATKLAGDLSADQVLYIEHPSLAEFTPDAYQTALAAAIGAAKPRAVLMGSTSIGSDVASVLSARLQLPLVSSCRKVSRDGKLHSQICGGKIMAETQLLPESTVLITVIPGGHSADGGHSTQAPPVTSLAPADLSGLRISLQRYLEPEAGDVDISKEAVLVAIGRGIQNGDNVELAEELAKALGGVVCGSRPVVDQGWLSASRLVGKSGKRVKPKLYLALGISGAPEHMEAVTDSELLVAVNTDAAAPIFGVAKYGTTLDLFDLVPALTAAIQKAKAA
jgi:electron transfer flavoprotein alpha subunit